MKSFLTILFTASVLSLAFSQEPQQSTEQYRRTESIGGKLDFNKILDEEGKTDTLILFDGIAYSSKEYALVLWGQAVKKLGIPTFKEAVDLWKSIHQTELSKSSLKALKKGYKM